MIITCKGEYQLWIDCSADLLTPTIGRTLEMYQHLSRTFKKKYYSDIVQNQSGTPKTCFLLGLEWFWHFYSYKYSFETYFLVSALCASLIIFSNIFSRIFYLPQKTIPGPARCVDLTFIRASVSFKQKFQIMFSNIFSKFISFYFFQFKKKLLLRFCSVCRPHSHRARTATLSSAASLARYVTTNFLSCLFTCFIICCCPYCHVARFPTFPPLALMTCMAGVASINASSHLTISY